jgi:ATP dependent DNA ligase domain
MAGSGPTRPSSTATVVLRPSGAGELCFGPGGATVSQTDSPRLPGRVRSCRRTRYVFDVLVHRGCDVIRLPLESRRELLTDAIRKVGYPVIQSIAFDVKPGDLVKAAKALELEGVIAKRKGSLYESGRRSGAWVKYKINRSQEFVIGGYTVGNPFDALIVGCYEDRSTLRFQGQGRIQSSATTRTLFSSTDSGNPPVSVRKPAGTPPLSLGCGANRSRYGKLPLAAAQARGSD